MNEVKDKKAKLQGEARCRPHPPLSLCLFTFYFLLLTLAAVSRDQPAPAVVKAVESVGMTVSDMERAIDFYSKVLTFEKV